MSAVSAVLTRYDAITMRLSGAMPESLVLAFVRVVLAGVFWRSGRTKVTEGSWFQLSDTTYELFRTEYAAVPLPPELAAVMATTAEHLLPALLLAGLFTRFSALCLVGMTMVIQLFVYPDAWWPEHSLWTAMALILIVRGGGQFSFDALLAKARR